MRIVAIPGNLNYSQWRCEPLTEACEQWAIGLQKMIRATQHEVKSTIADARSQPETTPEENIYQALLETIHSTGKQMGATPSTYKGKDEEALRDILLISLQNRVRGSGSATGEAINRDGKTDILVHFGKSRVLVAECKFWDGPKKYKDAITQLFGNLSWHDSYSALILFVRSEGLSSVIKNVKRATPEHPNHLGIVDEKAETWLNYRFHTNGDLEREVKLAVLLIHVPRS